MLTTRFRKSGQRGRIAIRTSQQGSNIEVAITDNGTGVVDPERIFDPFYTTKQAAKGTGLGLSICYGIVRAHGGEILCRNNEERAWQHVYRARARGDGGGYWRRRSQKRRGDEYDRRILVIEDEPSVSAFVRAALERRGYSVVDASSGAEGLRATRQTEYSGVISDIRMPGSVNGAEVHAWIQQNRPELWTRNYFDQRGHGEQRDPAAAEAKRDAVH